MASKTIPTNTSDTLSQTLPLVDIITPTTVSSWPPALGWYLAAALLAVMLAIVVIYIAYYLKHYRYRKEALAQLKQIMRQPTQNQAENNQQLLQVLKQTAMTAYPLQNLEQVYGKAWVAVLKQQAPTLRMGKEIINTICYGQYQAQGLCPPEMIHDFCQQWIKRHHRRWQGVSHAKL